MRHLVTVQAQFIVDDSNFVEWQTPEGEIFDQLKNVGNGPIVSSVTSVPHPQDKRLGRVWQQVIDKHTKKGIFDTE